MASYDAYGRPLRGHEPSHFETSDSSAADYNYPQHSEARDIPIHNRRESPRRRSPPLGSERMASSVDSRDQAPSMADGVSPELIAAITEKVKKEVFEQLKQTNTEIPAQGPPMQREASNKSDSTSSPPPTARRVYTPPSPSQTGRQTYVPSFAPPPTTFIPPPPPTAEPMRSSPSSPLEEPAGGMRFSERAAPQPSSPLDKPSGVRFSDRGAASRPTGSRTFSTAELSTIDQKWGRLFESDGKPTKRLGQFLRGMANHIIEEFPIKKTIVVTPSKMAAYYASHALEDEPHPLLTIFRAQSNEHISRLYQDLGCQHHLIQEDSHSAPIVPSLTPVGFAHWMTINILAYPEEESQRLSKVVIAMPIDADGDLVDGKPERLPKQISRHLLPDREDRSSRKLLDKAIEDFLDDLGSTSRRKASIASPPLSRHSSSSQTRSHPVEIHQQPRTSPRTAKAQPIERERKPYGGVPSETSSATGEEGIKIERERQPYSAQPGTGKVHADNLNVNSSRPGRANSTSSRNSNSAREQPDELRHVRTNSSTNRYRPRAGGNRRSSSPPFKSFSQSTPDDINASAPRYGQNPTSSSSSFSGNPSSNSRHGSDAAFPPPPPPSDRDRRYRRGTMSGVDREDAFPEFNSPREAERWDRFQEGRGGGFGEDRERGGYERGSVSVDPRERGERGGERERGAPVEEWYREKGRPGEEYGGRRY